MKRIIDYKRTETIIKVNNNEEYNQLVPLLNQEFSGQIP